MDKKYKFSFPEGNVQDSIVYKMVTDFKIEPSILRAEIDESGCGSVILRLKGDDENIDRALDHAASCGVAIEELGRHISRDDDICFDCGACVSICPTKSFYINPETFEVDLNIETCVACGSCLTVCSAHAVKLTL